VAGGWSGRRWSLVLGLLVVLAAGCSSDPSGHTVTIEAGQVPAAEVPVAGHSNHGLATLETVPLAKQNPTTALFSAIGVFQGCLQQQGVTFVGAPNPSDPSSPANNPNYLKTLGTCAARSDIVQALKAAQTAQDNLTPSQIKTENQYYLSWRKCMIARGWGIPTPTPNSKGMLFSFGTSGGGATNFTPPPGQSILSSSDMQDCASQVTEQGHGVSGG
jgi:hypothetical protein